MAAHTLEPTIVSYVVDHVLTAPLWLVLGVVGLVVFSEDALFLGFVLPGETVAIVAGGAALGSVVVMIGYAAGASYKTVHNTLGNATALGSVTLILVGVTLWRIRKHHTDTSASSRS